MAGEIQIPYAANKTVYVFVLNRIGQFWNTNTSAFEAYNSANITNYAISATQVSAVQTIYLATFPAAIPAGVYGILGKNQLTGSPAEADPNIGEQDFQWNGTAEFPLSDLIVSGQVGQRIARGVMIQNVEFCLVSSADHITPFISGVVSGQISRDGGPFGALQSGAFAEVGLGFYSLQALTSGDLLCNTFGLIFTANGISGGIGSDPYRLTGLTQRSSG